MQRAIGQKVCQYIVFSFFCFLALMAVILNGLSLNTGLMIFGLVFLSAGLWLKPIFGLVALIILRPAVDLIGTKDIFQINSLALSFHDLLGLLVVLWGIVFIYQNRNLVKDLPARFFLLGFLAVAFLSSLWAPSFTLSIGEALRIASIFILSAVSFILIRSLKSLKFLIYGFLASSVIPCLLAISQYFQGRGQTVYGEFFYRLYGSFFHPNSLAFFLVFICVIIFTLLSIQKQSWQKTILGAWMAVLILIILATYTRGAWLGFLWAFLVLATVNFRRALILGLGIILTFYLVVPIIQERINDIVLLDPFSSLMWRLNLWREMVPFLTAKPLLGNGLGSFQALSGQIQPLSTLPAPEAHNDYLKILVELGIIGLVFYLAIYFKVLIFSLKAYFKTKDKPLKTIILGLIAMTSAFILMALGDNLLRTTATQWLYFSYFGAVASVARNNVRRNAN